MGIFSGFVGFLFFLIIEVAWAQILLDTLIAEYESGLLTVIIISGFLLSVVISVIASLLTSEITLKKYAIIAGLYAFIVNILLWMFISYFMILKEYPEIIDDLAIWEKIIGIFQIMSNYAIYILHDVTQLWALAQISYAILFTIFLKLLGTKQKSRNYYDFSGYK